MAITGKSDRSRIEVVFEGNGGETSLDVWFTPGNPRNVEYIDDIRRTVNGYYLKSGNPSDIAKASRSICDSFDKMTDPGTAENIFRYDTSENYETFMAVVEEMGRIMKQYSEDRSKTIGEAKNEAMPHLVV